MKIKEKRSFFEINELKIIKQELSTTEYYMRWIELNRAYSDKIQDFIVKEVNKYRTKIEVKNFYQGKESDDIYGNQYETFYTGTSKTI